MCGRFGLTISWSELYDAFSMVLPERMPTEIAPRYNIAPTTPIIVIVNGPDGRRQPILARWGLIPGWVKDPADFTTLINARSETAAEKPSFRNAMRHRRALVPADGFYEWQRFGKGKKSQPYWVRRSDGERVAFGALVETWMGADGSEIDTACILTTEANDTFAPIHNRLPLVIQPEDFDRWLDCADYGPGDVSDLMKPAPDTFFEPVPVSDAVNRVANDNAALQERVDATPTPDQEPPSDQLSLL